MLQRLCAVTKYFFIYLFWHVFRRAMTLWGRLHYRGIVFRFPVGQVNFLLFRLSRRSFEAHPAFCLLGTEGSFLGDGTTVLFRGVRRKLSHYRSYFEVGHPIVMKITEA